MAILSYSHLVKTAALSCSQTVEDQQHPGHCKRAELYKRRDRSSIQPPISTTLQGLRETPSTVTLPDETFLSLPLQMTSDEIELLQDIGHVLLENLTVIATQFIFYGIYLAIFAYGIRVLLKRRPWTRYTWILFSLLSVLCLLSTADLALVVAVTVKMITGVLIESPEKTLVERFQLVNSGMKGLYIAQTWLGGGGSGGFLLLFADAVVVWRTCVLCPDNTAARTVPLIMLFVSLVISIASAALNTVTFTGSNIVPSSSPLGVMLILSVSLSLATNAVATVLIGYKTYYHRRMMRTTIGLQSSSAGTILLFLTESGAVFCVLQIIALATTTAVDSDFTALIYASIVWSQITLFAAAAYPIFVIIVVDSHRSIFDRITGDSTDARDQDLSPGRLPVGSHISFVARPLTPAGISGLSGGDVGMDSMTGSCIVPTSSSSYSI